MGLTVNGLYFDPFFIYFFITVISFENGICTNQFIFSQQLKENLIDLKMKASLSVLIDSDLGQILSIRSGDKKLSLLKGIR